MSSRLRALLFPLLSERAIRARLRGNISSGHRRALLASLGATIGTDVRMSHPLHAINAGRDYSRLSIGNNVFVGCNVLFDLKDRIEIGDDVTLSMNVVLSTHTEVGRIPLSRLFPPSTAPVRIHRNVYVGTGAIILQGVSIGPDAVVAAGAVVRQDVAPLTVVGGVPARALRTLERSVLS